MGCGEEVRNSFVCNYIQYVSWELAVEVDSVQVESNISR